MTRQRLAAEDSDEAPPQYRGSTTPVLGWWLVPGDALSRMLLRARPFQLSGARHALLRESGSARSRRQLTGSSSSVQDNGHSAESHGWISSAKFWSPVVVWRSGLGCMERGSE